MRTALVSLLTVALLLSGCASPHRIDRGELARLHGFEGGDAVALKAIGGDAVAFTRESQLGIVLVGGEEITHRYSGVEVIEGVFYGTVDGTDAQVAVALDQIAYGQVWPKGTGEVGKVGVMVFTMWVLFAAIGLVAYVIYHWADSSDSDVEVIIITSF